MRQRLLPLVLSLLLWPAAARGGEDEPLARTPVLAADAVLAALEDTDEAALTKLAAAEVPDAWLVADELHARKAYAAALGFARASQRIETRGLVEYLETIHATSLAAQRQVLARAEKARAAGSHAEALMTLGDADAGAHVVGVRTEALRADLLEHKQRLNDAGTAFDRAAKMAAQIGWRTEASHLLYRASVVWNEYSDYQPMLASIQRRLKLETELASKIGMGRAHFGIAIAYASLGEPAKYASHLERAHALARASGDGLYLAKVTSQRAHALAIGGDARGALKAYEKGLADIAAFEPKSMRPRFRPTARAVYDVHLVMLKNSASMASKVDDVHAAKRFANRAVQVARKTGSARTINHARAFLAMLEGVVQETEGRPLAALAHLERARRLYAQLGRREEMADLLRRIGSVKSELGDLPSALEDIHAAIRILIGTQSLRKQADAGIAAGHVCWRMGRRAEARMHYRTALHVAERLQDPLMKMDVLSHLAAVHRSRAEYGQALALLHRAKQIHQSTGGVSDAWAVELGLARTHADMGDSAMALRILEATMKTMTSRRAAAFLNSARSLKASLLFADEEYDSARAEVELLVAAHEKSNNRNRLGGALAFLGHVHHARRDFKAAREQLERAVGIHVAERNRAGETRTRIAMGRVLIGMHEDEGGLGELTLALDMATELQDVEIQATALSALAEAHYFRGELDDAMRCASEGIALVAHLALGLSEGVRAVARSQFRSLPRWGVLAAGKKGDGRALYQFLEHGRATALVASLGGRAAIREAQVPAELREAEDRAKAASAVAYRRYDAARGKNDRKARMALRRELEKARAAERDVVAAIQRAVRSQADLTYADPTPLPDVQAALAKGDALVMYATPSTDYAALVITRTSIRLVSLGPVASIDASIDRLTDDPKDAKAIAALQSALVAPLDLGADVRRVLVSPEGKACYMALGALWSDRDVCFVPSATALHALRASRDLRGEGVLALGDPSYDARPAPTAAEKHVLRGRRLTPLPATRDEVKAIGHVILLGKDASETKLRNTLPTRPRWRAVHLACHGLVDDVRPTSSALALTHDARSDGFLYAHELFAQVPVPADLVVLSACETGRGRVIHGEGLLGLSRAFMLAGAPRVLASLWKVDDAATSALMVKFYELWNPKGEGAERKSAASALREAQAYVRAQEQWKSPYYWAAWVLWGLPD